MFQPVSDKVVVKIPHKYIKQVSDIQRLSSLQNGSSIDPADYVEIRGEVVMLPKKISEDKKHLSMSNIQVGDIAIFSYQVIYDILYKAETDKFEYRNMVTYNGEEYFLADISKIFAVVRDNEIIMINGWVMLEEYPKSIIVLQNQNKKVKGTVQSKVMYVEKNKSLKSGDTVLYSPFKPQHYQINGKPFIILKKSHILGTI